MPRAALLWRLPEGGEGECRQPPLPNQDQRPESQYQPTTQAEGSPGQNAGVQRSVSAVERQDFRGWSDQRKPRPRTPFGFTSPSPCGAQRLSELLRSRPEASSAVYHLGVSSTARTEMIQPLLPRQRRVEDNQSSFMFGVHFGEVGLPHRADGTAVGPAPASSYLVGDNRAPAQDWRLRSIPDRA